MTTLFFNHFKVCPEKSDACNIVLCDNNLTQEEGKIMFLFPLLGCDNEFFQIHLLHMEIAVQGNNLRNIRHIEVVICQITYPSNLRIIASLHEFNCNKKKPQALLTVSLRKECVGEIHIKEMMEEKYF